MLVAALGDTDDAVRDSAAEALSGFGKDAVGPLIGALQHADPAVRAGPRPPCTTWGRTPGTQSARSSWPSKATPTRTCRETAAYALGGVGPTAKDAVEPLAAAAVGKDANLHGPALMALGAIGKDAVPTLVRMLKEKERDVRETAPLALALVGPAAREAVGQLIELLKDDDVEVRFAAAAALGAVGSEGKESVAPLAAALGDKEGKVRAQAARALGRLGGEAADAVPALDQRLEGPR